MVLSLLVDSSTEAVSQEGSMEVMYLVTKMGKIIKSNANFECVTCLHKKNNSIKTDLLSLFLCGDCNQGLGS